MLFCDYGTDINFLSIPRFLPIWTYLIQIQTETQRLFLTDSKMKILLQIVDTAPRSTSRSRC